MDIINELLNALQSQDRVRLATIISTSGSTPAAALSKMMVTYGGKSWVGTVGGGCLEGDVLEEAIRLFKSDTATIRTFQLNETNLDQGLICGGTLDVLIEPISKRDLPWLQQLHSNRQEGKDSLLVTFISAGGRIETKSCLTIPAGRVDDPSLAISLNGFSDLVTFVQNTEPLEDVIRTAHHRNETRRIKTNAGELIIEPVGGLPRLLIFGGGHVSKYVSRTAAMAGFRITIIDDRAEYANRERFPEAERTLACDFTQAVKELEITPSTYIVIVTRGHRSDEEILGSVVASSAKYIGMIGSRRKVLTTFEHLSGRGIPAEMLKRVQAPIGIEIGATTAEEIAISVVAQLIAVRRGEISAQRNKSEAMASLVTRIRGGDRL